jgi:ATP-dependent DNA helicase RecQ
MTIEGLLNRTLSLDLETTLSGKIRHLGAIFDGRIFEKTKQAGSKAVIEQLDDFAQDAEFILGHNLLGHDFPVLKTTSPWLKLLDKPVIDTLYLSPLAFPQNPYHHLVKNYKLVRSSINSPVEDAKLAASVFRDQWESFITQAAENPRPIDFYRFCFQDSLFNTFSGKGIASVFSQISPANIQLTQDALDCFYDTTTGIVCPNQAMNNVAGMLEKDEMRPALAYAMAWLQVAGGNSVLPPWVRHSFPNIPAIIKTLREDPCGRPDCEYCNKNHDPEQHLTNLFGYPSFREKPSAENGESLQQAIVTGCLAGNPTLGILPTGGGKSLCFQLPALVRYQRRGSLTVVISPLQALMKDQVDNLVKKTGTPFAEAVSGLQTPPERGEVFNRIRLGDTAILYISPEALRSTSLRNVLSQREIGCWVFDEAHCLSKWGHDFRSDYLYAARFIREFSKEQNLPVPPIACFTATAKTDVVEEIKVHFRDELGQELHLFIGGIERDNLTFEVIPVSTAEKFETAHEIIQEHIKATDEPAGIIVYAATRRSTEEISEFLSHQGMPAEAFHAGLDAKEKREIIESFVEGDIPVICATNAFGMGIDKENIRLVLHYEMPGSLENYIQEAGRAGRDTKPAHCILLYDKQDASKQFQMGSFSELRQKEIARILRALRRTKKNQHGEIIVTSDELLRDDDLADMKDLQPEFRDTKVKTAISWLERAGFLERNQNRTDIFQGKPLVESLGEAQEMISRLNLPSFTKNLWMAILLILFNRAEERGVRADSIAEAVFPEKDLLQKMEEKYGLTAAQIILSALHDMAGAGLIDQGIMLSAIFRPKGKNKALGIFRNVCELEKELIKFLQDEDPDADDGSWVMLNIRRLNQRLTNEGHKTNPDILRQLIKGISYDGKGMAGSQGSFELRYINRNQYQVKLQRSWNNIKKTISVRHNVAHTILQTLVDKAHKRAAKLNAPLTSDVRLSFTSDELSGAIKADIALSVEVKKVLPAIDRALMFLHEQKVIALQGGLAILRQAMTVSLTPLSKGRYYRKSDFKPLAIHYSEKRLQVHVMTRYSDMALEKITEALTLVIDYFALRRSEFIQKYFEDDVELLDKATTAESYRSIVENLRNPVQISAVGRPIEDNMLILAGPGSGKTKVIVHRCAYLLEVERIPARQILVLCFNHSSAVELRKRLFKLVGKAARGVTIATYHGAAMRLAGISIRDMVEPGNQDRIDFDAIIKGAVNLLKGEGDILGIDADEVRERLLAGYSHILVDEYQDIDEDQYDLVSAIAGRSLEEKDSQLTLLAVGDDDQNIYTFRGANVRFIRRFQKDYPSETIFLVENYRSSGHIIAASNALIRTNRDRMKGEHPIQINHERKSIDPGGRWSHLDPVGQGRVRIVSVDHLNQQAEYIKTEIDRLRELDPKANWQNFAVLSRSKSTLSTVRTVLEEAYYPIKTTLEKGLSLHRLREFQLVLNWLASKEKENIRASDIQKHLNVIRHERKMNVWWRLLVSFFDSYKESTDDSILPCSWAIDRLYEFAAEQRRDKVIGQGIFMSTIHSAKGMEFPHVFILDGDWHAQTGKNQWEEERRVMYVGMTRAEETLHLLKLSAKANPFLKELRGNFMMPFVYRGKADTTSVENRQYKMLGLEQIYMDYAAGFPEGHRIHEQLSKLGAGDSVSFCEKSSRIEIHNGNGNCLARLSQESSKKWSEHLEDILDVRVLAMYRRNKEDPADGFQERIKIDSWELPILEVVHKEITGPVCIKDRPVSNPPRTPPIDLPR